MRTRSIKYPLITALYHFQTASVGKYIKRACLISVRMYLSRTTLVISIISLHKIARIERANRFTVKWKICVPSITFHLCQGRNWSFRINFSHVRADFMAIDHFMELSKSHRCLFNFYACIFGGKIKSDLVFFFNPIQNKVYFWLPCYHVYVMMYT